MFDFLKRQALTLCDDFTAKLAAFRQGRAALRARIAGGNLGPEEREEAKALLSRGDGLEKLASEAAGYVAKFRAWIAGSLPDSAILGREAAAEAEGVNGLGVLPVLPIALVAVIVAATAALAKWALDYAEFSKRLDFARENNLDPSRAADFVGDRDSGGLFDFKAPTGLILGAALLGGALLYFNRKG